MVYLPGVSRQDRRAGEGCPWALEQLRGKKQEADDFDAPLADDPIRDLLRWLADLQAFQLRCGEERWSARLDYHHVSSSARLVRLALHHAARAASFRDAPSGQVLP